VVDTRGTTRHTYDKVVAIARVGIVQLERRSLVVQVAAIAAGIAIPIVAIASLLGYGFPLWSDPGPRGAVAVKVSGGNTVIVLKACGASPRVTSVYVDSARDVHEVVWRIESASGSDRDSYVIGETPAGFEQVIPLATALSTGVRYYLNASQPGDRPLGLPGVVFDPGELRGDRWIVSRGRTLTDAELASFDPC